MAGTAGTLHVTEHPLVQHKLTLLGQRATSTPAFGQLLREVIPVDPMPATGHSASAAIDRLKQARAPPTSRCSAC